MMNRNLLLQIPGILFCICSLYGQKHTNNMDAFIQSLLNKMTLEEKIGQMNLLTPGWGIPTGSVVSNDVESKIKAGMVGGLFGIHGPEKIKKAQDLAVQHSRLKIPLLFGSDVIHGYETTFPIPLAMSCSWDMVWIEKAARIAAIEASSNGINWTFSPMVDICRDPRWGRIAEGAGEDAFLGSKIAQAMVKGYQGNDLSQKHNILACVKHFALYGASEGGRDYNTTDMSRLRMYQDYLPPYKAAVEAGVGSVMTSFNEIDGIPATGNKWLLTDLLRKEWGFKGLIVSDYTSVNEMIDHGIGDLYAASLMAFRAGLNMDMVGEGFLQNLPKAFKKKQINLHEVNASCKVILEAKYKLGLFHNPYKYIDSTLPRHHIFTHEHRSFAREMAARSVVLLKNEMGVLPLQPKERIALIGPFANDRSNMLGTWSVSGIPDSSVSVYEGFLNVVNDTRFVRYCKGANISDDTTLAKNVNVFGTRIHIDQRSPEAMLEEAVALANDCDKIVLLLGEASEMSGESSSRTDLQLPQSQMRLLTALAKTGKPIICVVFAGRPLVLQQVAQLSHAMIYAWHMGTEAGNALADVLYGRYNPSGKLTCSFPYHVGQIPVYYNHKNTGRPATSQSFEKFKSHYLDAPNKPLYPFGFGLSYTQFQYGPVVLDKNQFSGLDSLTASLELSNTGPYDGEEIVQCYIRDMVGSITRPVKELKGFQKIHLKSGETKKIRFVLTEKDLRFYNAKLQYKTEPGDFQLMIGRNSEDTQNLPFRYQH